MSTVWTDPISVNITTTGTCTGCCENADDCCPDGGELADDLYLTLASTDCPDIDGVVIHLVRDYLFGNPLTSWSFSDSTGGANSCATVATATFECTTQVIAVAFVDSNSMSGTSTDTLDCDAVSLTYAMAFAIGTGDHCCLSTVTDCTGVLTE